MGVGAEGRCPLFCALALAPPSCHTEEIIMVIKCPLVTIHMPKCDLLNVIFAIQHRHL